MSVKLSVLLEHIISDAASYGNISISALTNDSREVVPGTLFLAFQGHHVDGRDYIAHAIAQGALAICYDPNDFDLSVTATIPLIPVPLLQQNQSLIASIFYAKPSEQLSVIGVTGTNGKTSVTHFIAQALGKQCAVIGTTGYGFLPNLSVSKNTTPDPVHLQSMIADSVDAHAKQLAMEVSSHGLVEKRMQHVAFDIAVFTNLSREHLDFHGTMENYARAKFMLFEQPGLKHAVINVDNVTGKNFSRDIASGIELVTFSAAGNRQADIIADHFIATQEGFSAAIKTPWGEGDFNTHLLGYFNLENVLAVIGVLGLLGMPFDNIQQAIAALHPAPGRMMLYKDNNLPTVAVDYAHTPDALESALSALKTHCQGKLWCVFGCGGDRDPGKRAQMGSISEQLSDFVVLTNDNPRSESPVAIVKDIRSGMSEDAKVKTLLDRRAAITYAIEAAAPNDFILVAGKGHETKQLIGDQIINLSDTDIVSTCFKPNG